MCLCMMVGFGLACCWLAFEFGVASGGAVLVLSWLALRACLMVLA